MNSSPFVVNGETHRGATVHNGSQDVLIVVPASDDGEYYNVLHWATGEHPGPSNGLFSAGSPGLRTSGPFAAVRGAGQATHYEAEAWERAPTALQDQAAATTALLQFVRANERLPDGDEVTEEMREELGSMCAAGFLHRMVTFASSTARMSSRNGKMSLDGAIPRLAHLYDDYVKARIAIQTAYAAAGRPTAAEFLELSDAAGHRTALVRAMNGVCMRLAMAHDAVVSLVSTAVVKTDPDEEEEARFARNHWNRAWATSEEFKPVLGRMLAYHTLGLRNVCPTDNKFHAVPLAEALGSDAQRDAMRRAGMDPDHHDVDRVYVRGAALESAIAGRNVERSRLALLAAFPGLHSGPAGAHSALADARLAPIAPERRPTEEADLQAFMWASAIDMALADAGEDASIADEIFAALDSLALYKWSHGGASPPVAQSFANVSMNTTAMAAVVSRHRPKERQSGSRAAADIIETAVVNIALSMFSRVVAAEDMWARQGLTLRASHYLKAYAPSLESEAAALVMTPPLQEDPSGQLWAARMRADKQARGDSASMHGPLSIAEADAVDSRSVPGPDAITMVTVAEEKGFSAVPGSFPAHGDIADDAELYEARAYRRLWRGLRRNLFWSPPMPETAAITGVFSSAEWRRTLQGPRAERWGAWQAALCIATREGMRAGDIAAPPVMDLESLQRFYRRTRLNTTLYVLSERLDRLSMGMPGSRAYFTRLVARRRAAAGELEEEDDRAEHHINQPGAPRAVVQAARDASEVIRTASARTAESALRALDDFQRAVAGFAAVLAGVRFSANGADTLYIAVPEPVPAFYSYTTAEAAADAFEGIMAAQAALSRAEAYVAAVLTYADGYTPEVTAAAAESLGAAGALMRQAVGTVMLKSNLSDDDATLRSTIRRFRPSMG